MDKLLLMVAYYLQEVLTGLCTLQGTHKDKPVITSLMTGCLPYD